jgi:hypothetical protein
MQSTNMGRRTDVRRILPLAVALSLSAIVLLSACAPLPLLRPSQLSSLEEGTSVRVEGVVTAIVIYESGWTTLTLTDLGDGASAKVLCAPSGPSPPSDIPSIGDLVSAAGESSHDDAMPVLFSTWDSITVLARSHSVLDVRALCENWEHFLGDRFEVGGVVRSGPLLADPSGQFAISMAVGSLALQMPSGLTVVVDSTLFMDYGAMALVLRVWSVLPAPA